MLRFTKMHGLGNDYVYVDGFDQDIPDAPGELAKVIADRHFGVGGDGMILILPSDSADVRMRMFNADGSEGEMCGNGVRCVAKYAWDHDRAKANPMHVETGAGILRIDLQVENGKVQSATVDMGQPILEAERIPSKLPGERNVDVPLEIGGKTMKVTCVSMGNPHAVVFVEDVGSVLLEQWGPELENHPSFPNRINVHFVQVHDKTEVTVRTWERGSGVTLACGTGASAVCVAGVLTGRTDRAIIGHLPGGDLNLHWQERDNHVKMTGPASEVFSGEWPEK